MDIQFSTEEEVTFELWAYRSSGGRVKDSREVTNIELWLGYENATSQREHEDPPGLKHVRDVQTIGDRPCKGSLGSLGMGTYHLKIIIRYHDGHTDDSVKNSFEVKHPAVDYRLHFFDSGRELVFESRGGRNQTFNLSVYANWGDRSEPLVLRSNVTNAKIRIPGKDYVSVSVYVTDEYDWTCKGGDPHTYVYQSDQRSKDVRIVTVIIIWVAVVLLSAAALAWRSKK